MVVVNAAVTVILTVPMAPPLAQPPVRSSNANLGARSYGNVLPRKPIRLGAGSSPSRDAS